MSIDKQKELVTVKGSMDMKALAESLQEKLKRPVEIVPPKKDNKDGDGGGKDGSGGGKKKGGGGGGDGGGQAQQEAGQMQERKMEYQPFGFGYGYGYPPPVVQPGFGFGYGYPPGYVGEHLHAPQMFSDENPNACSIM